MTAYAIHDFKAVMKHCYYSAEGDTVRCDEADRRFPTWQSAAQCFLTRYFQPLVAGGGSPRTLLVAHDMGQQYRSAILPDYKKKPTKPSPVEQEQLTKLYAWAKGFFAAVGATQIGVDGVEADDVIAWLCERLTDQVEVYTVDSDLLQLVNDKTSVYLKLEPHYGEGEHKGIPYHLTSISKSIIGDTSDGYGGVPGMGPAKFQLLLETYGEDGIRELQDAVETGNTDLIDSAIEQTKDKLLIKLRENFGHWRDQWRVAKLHPELCWKPRARKLVKPLIVKRVPNAERLIELLSAVGAMDLWDEVFAQLVPTFIAITSENWGEKRSWLLEQIRKSQVVSFDYESSNKSPVPGFAKASAQGDDFVDVLSQELTGASFCFGEHFQYAIYIPVDHRDSPNLSKAVVAEVLEYAGRHCQLVAHNAFFEGVVSRTNLGVDLRDVHDTRMMQRYFNENEGAGLKAMSKAYLDYEQTSYETVLADKENMSELTLDEVFNYGIDDSLCTALLYDLMRMLLQLDEQLAFYERWAVKPTVVLQRAYIDGVNMNWALQKRVHEDDIRQVAESLEELRQILKENVTGEVTDGCKSFIEAEQEYQLRSWRAKFEKDGATRAAATEKAKEKVYEWKKRLEASCQYIPYSEELVMPAFAFTANQLNKATAALGLPEIPGVTNKALGEYLGNLGMLGWEPPKHLNEAQLAFLKALADALERGAAKVSQLELKAEEGDEKAAAKAVQARAAFDHLAVVVQKLAGVEPKLLTYGDELNVGSPAQMQSLIYCKIGVPVRLRGKNLGKNRLVLGIKDASPSSDETAINTALANDVVRDSWQWKALKALLKAKAASTRISLYHEKYPLWRHRDGKVHPSFTDAGTDTRRPTGSAPNALQVSKKDLRMRSMYVPPDPDYVCVAIDFNGQELRLLACESGDPVMIDAYDPNDEKDLHSVTGSGIARKKLAGAVGVERDNYHTLSDFRVFDAARSDEAHPLSKLAVSIRKSAKGVNFGLAYGAGGSTLSRNLIVALEEAQELLDGAMSLYARIPQWQKETAQFMEKNGFTLTAFGTKRHATDDIFSKDSGKSSRQHRQGTNATIQGTAAEMLRIVLTGMVERDLLDKLRMVFFAPIYDEIVAWVHKDDVVEYCRNMHELMEGSTPPHHPIRQQPEISIGPDWGRVHELGRWTNLTAEQINALVEQCLEEAKQMWEEDLSVPFEAIHPELAA